MSAAGDLLAADRAARRAAQRVFDRPLVLEAGAGTGKTTTLVARMLAWLLGAGWEEASRTGPGTDEPLAAERVAARALEGVVAITFTEAAAAEMAARLGRRLAELARHGEIRGPGFDAELLAPRPLPAADLALRARALLGGLERVTISTIHAFCASLLRRHALSLGLHPDFRIDAREDLSEEVAREVVESATRRAYARGGDAPILELAARNIDSQRLVEAAARFTAEGTPASAFAEPGFSPPRLAAVRDELARRVDDLRRAAGERLRNVARTPLPLRVDQALAATATRLVEEDEPGIAGFAALLESLADLWEPKLLGRLASWQKADLTQGEEAAFDEAAAAIAAAAGPLRDLVAHLLTLDPRVAEYGRRAMHPILIEVESLLRARGIATFQSLLVETHRLLSQSGPRRRERTRIRQLLVDEFQDTDELQCEIVAHLALEGPGAERPGLFVVGDPKQSIYAWRNADLEAYERFVGRAVEQGGERHRLARNFRSAPPILAEVERALSQVMVAAPGRQPPFEPLLPGDHERLPAAFTTAGASPIEYWVSWRRESLPRSTGTREAAEIEARAIAADIRRLHEDHDEPWNEFAVLLRSTGRLDEFLEAFRALGVPFAVTGDRQYFRRREVIEAAALLRAIVHPLDHIALLCFLRSPTVGVPDAAWIPLWKRRFPDLVTELGDHRDGERLAALDAAVEAAARETPRLEDLEPIAGPAGWPRALGAALRSLADLRRAFRRLPVDRFIELLRTRVLLEATEAARYLGVYRLANLERFFRRLEEGLAGGHGDIETLLRALKRSVAEAREDEEALPKEAAADAVQVMTIHKAKGLEFGHVYLPQLHAMTRQGEHDVNDADRRPPPEEPREYVLFGRRSLGWDRVEAERTASAAAEQVRTLYVAMTRAQRRLVLVGNWSRRPKPPSGVGVPRPLELLHHRAPFPTGMTRLVGAVEGSADGFADGDGVRWKIPDLERERDEPARAPRRPIADAPALGRATAWAEELARDRQEADRRMERPLLAAASSQAAELADAAHAGAEAPSATLPRAVARVVGRLVHQALETWDLEASPQAETERQRRRVVAAAARAVGGEPGERAAAWCEELFDRLAAGELLARLYASAPAIVARELPLAVACAAGDEPLVGFTGTVDLLLRSPDDDRLVVVDYKTDEVTGDAAIAERARIYSSQLAIYARAVQAAMGLDRAPRAELWFLWPGVSRPAGPTSGAPE